MQLKEERDAEKCRNAKTACVGLTEEEGTTRQQHVGGEIKFSLARHVKVAPSPNPEARPTPFQFMILRASITMPHLIILFLT